MAGGRKHQAASGRGTGDLAPAVGGGRIGVVIERGDGGTLLGERGRTGRLVRGPFEADGLNAGEGWRCRWRRRRRGRGRGRGAVDEGNAADVK